MSYSILKNQTIKIAYAQNKKLGSIHKLKIMLWHLNGLVHKRARV